MTYIKNPYYKHPKENKKYMELWIPEKITSTSNNITNEDYENSSRTKIIRKRIYELEKELQNN